MRRLLRGGGHDSAPACTALDAWLIGHPDLKTIAVYSPLPGEVDPAAALLRHPERRWVYPKVDGEHLTYHALENTDRCLQAGSFGILEPAAHLTEVPLREIDAFICPGLAFDKQGGRLGRGRGFYDRLLEKARPDALKVGLCFKEQMVPDTFSEPHDVRMDDVLF